MSYAAILSVLGVHFRDPFAEPWTDHGLTLLLRLRVGGLEFNRQVLQARDKA